MKNRKLIQTKRQSNYRLKCIIFFFFAGPPGKRGRRGRNGEPGMYICVCVCGQRSLTSQSRKVQGIIQQDIRKSYCTYNHVKVHCISLEAKIGYRCVICGLVVSVFTWIVSASVAIETLDFHSKTGRRVQLERVKVMPKLVEGNVVHV